MSKVYVICTGGTISMIDVSKSLDKTVRFQDEVQKILPKGGDYPDVEFKVYTPLIDSSEMTVELWNKIAEDIRDRYHEFDGFVILHGTDTMSYTASALSFILKNLNKPVILTGAQTPLSEKINDARENIINSIYLAAYQEIREVCICFNRTVYRGNRVTKFSTNDYDAYISANYPVLGRIQSTIELEKSLLAPAPKKNELHVATMDNFDVRIIYFTPNLLPEAFHQQIKGAKAIVLASYGDGNIRIRDPRFLEIMKTERAKGMIFINKSQCVRSNTIPKYDAGSLLSEAGMVSAGDQTLETILCKLLYLMSKKYNQSEIERAMQTPLRGEITPVVMLQQRFSIFAIKPDDHSSEAEAPSLSAHSSPTKLFK